jgi:hypothetical protein
LTSDESCATRNHAFTTGHPASLASSHQQHLARQPQQLLQVEYSDEREASGGVYIEDVGSNATSYGRGGTNTIYGARFSFWR